MREIKKGDIVSRESYNNDIIFSVIKIIKGDKKVALLKGIDVRVEADAPLDDLRLVDRNELKKREKEFEEKIMKRIDKIEHLSSRRKEVIYTGKILHLDGDKKYAEKSIMYYRKIGLNAIVKNIPENKQPKVVYRLLTIYNPDILVITGHDAMIKNGARYRDIYNYRN